MARLSEEEISTYREEGLVVPETAFPVICLPSSAMTAIA